MALFRHDGNVESALMTLSDNTPPEKLKDLNFRLLEAREKSHANNGADDATRNKDISSYSVAFRIGTEMVAALIVGVGIGYFLDYFFETKPLFLIVFFLLGAGAGVLNVYRATIGLGLSPEHSEFSDKTNFDLQGKKENQNRK